MRRWDRKYKANLSLNMPAWTSRLEMVGGLGVVSLSFATYISSRFTFNTECSRRYSTFLNDSLTLFSENFFHSFFNFIESSVIHHRKSVFVLCHSPYQYLPTVLFLYLSLHPASSTSPTFTTATLKYSSLSLLCSNQSKLQLPSVSRVTTAR